MRNWHRNIVVVYFFNIIIYFLYILYICGEQNVYSRTDVLILYVLKID